MLTINRFGLQRFTIGMLTVNRFGFTKVYNWNAHCKPICVYKGLQSITTTPCLRAWAGGFSGLGSIYEFAAAPTSDLGSIDMLSLE